MAPAARAGPRRAMADEGQRTADKLVAAPRGSANFVELTTRRASGAEAGSAPARTRTSDWVRAPPLLAVLRVQAVERLQEQRTPLRHRHPRRFLLRAQRAGLRNPSVEIAGQDRLETLPHQAGERGGGARGGDA